MTKYRQAAFKRKYCKHKNLTARQTHFLFLLFIIQQHLQKNNNIVQSFVV